MMFPVRPTHMVSCKDNTHGFPVKVSHTNQNVSWIFEHPVASLQSRVNRLMDSTQCT